MSRFRFSLYTVRAPGCLFVRCEDKKQGANRYPDARTACFLRDGAIKAAAFALWFASNNRLVPVSGIRSRSIASPCGLCFKAEIFWLSDVCSCVAGHLRLSSQRLVSVATGTCVCQLEHLRLSRQRLAAVKQGGRAAGVKGFLPFRPIAQNWRIQGMSVR